MDRRPFLCRFIDDVWDLPRDESTDFKYFLTDKLKILSPNKSPFNKRILMLTRKLDREADLVGIGLLRRGIDYVRLNIDDIPAQLRIRFKLHPSNLNFEFRIGKEIVNTCNISLVWLRHFDTQAINFQGNCMVQKFSYQQWEDTFSTLQRNLPCEWISSPLSTLQSGDRIEQLSIAKGLGFSIPATLITNDPVAASDFYNECHHDIVLKALHHHDVEIDGKVFSMYSHRVLKQDLSKLDDLIPAPCVLQERVRKKLELRITVVGKRVFATEIHSQSSMNGRDDMHRCPLRDLPKMITDLEETIAERCTKLITSFGLRFGAIDLVVDKNDHLNFLELNPIGDWCWIENQSPQITEAMVDLIEEITKSRN